MITKATVVGTGRIGSNVAILLAKKKISHIRLYDSDCTGLKEPFAIFPFTQNQSGIEKVKIVKFAIRFFSKDITKVDAFTDDISVYSQLDSSFCIIDCRDNKDSFLNCNVAISLDGPYLFLDSTNKNIGKQTSNYIYEKENVYLQKAIGVIDNYLSCGLFQQKHLKFYDLRDANPNAINMI